MPVYIGEDDSPLFTRYNLSATLTNVERKMITDIQRLNERYILDTEAEDLAGHFAEKTRVEPIRLAPKEEIEFSEGSTKIDVSQEFQRAIRDRSRPYYVNVPELTFHVPFSGDPSLFQMQASRFNFAGNPQGQVKGNMLNVKVVAYNGQIDGLENQFNHQLGQIQTSLEWIKADVENWNASLEAKALAAIRSRKEQLAKKHEALQAFSYRKRSSQPGTSNTTVLRQRLPIAALPPLTGYGKDDPILEVKNYEAVLTALRSMASRMEKTPASFAATDEESLRDHFLVPLNAMFDGVQGEAFNKRGKTDILITHDGSPVFIGECKFWKGAKQYLETIDQLLSYLSWRDTKVAVLLFCRNKNFTEVLNTIKQTTPQHSHYRSTYSERESEFRYSFRQQDDPSRTCMLTVLCFHLPT
jgi:hypothetical protein